MNEGLRTCGKPSRGRYVRGCRCYMCRVANAEYSLEQSHRRDGGRRPRDTPMVSAWSTQQCRKHVRELLDHGWTKRGICAASGVGRKELRSLLEGHRNTPTSKDGSRRATQRMRRANHDALMALDGEPPKRGGDRVDSAPAVNAVRWLHAHGVGYARIAEASGISYSTVRKLALDPSPTCTQATVERLARVAVMLKMEAVR